MTNLSSLSTSKQVSLRFIWYHSYSGVRGNACVVLVVNGKREEQNMMKRIRMYHLRTLSLRER